MKGRWSGLSRTAVRMGIAMKDDERVSGRVRNRDEGEKGSGIAFGGGGRVKL